MTKEEAVKDFLSQKIIAALNMAAALEQATHKHNDDDPVFDAVLCAIADSTVDVIIKGCSTLQCQN